MWTSKIKEIINEICLIYNLSLKNHVNIIGVLLTIWFALLTLCDIPLSYKIDLTLYTILLLFIIIPILYYFIIFKNAVIIGKKYFFSFNESNYVKSPQLILNETLTSRFYFKLKMYPVVINEIKKNQNKYSLIIENANTIEIYPKKLNENLNQVYHNFGGNNYFCLEQDYENLSKELKVSLFFNLNKANSTEEIKIYLEYGSVIDKINLDPDFSPKNLIYKEKIFLSN
jgi:hypothetical protein